MTSKPPVHEMTARLLQKTFCTMEPIGSVVAGALMVVVAGPEVVVTLVTEPEAVLRGAVVAGHAPWLWKVILWSLKCRVSHTAWVKRQLWTKARFVLVSFKQAIRYIIGVDFISFYIVNRKSLSSIEQCFFYLLTKQRFMIFRFLNRQKVAYNRYFRAW